MGKGEIFDLQLSAWTLDEISRVLIDTPVDHGQGALSLVTINLDHIVHLTKWPDLLQVYRNSWLATADGMPVLLYARLRGVPLPGRVTGADLFRTLLMSLVAGRHRCVFVASCEATADRLSTILQERSFSTQDLLFVVPPFGFEHDAAYSATLTQQIRQFSATHVFFGVGAPKSEIWVHNHRNDLGDCYVLNVGAGLDFAAGTKRRAPVIVQRAGLEWLWRFAQEPRRLFKRYFIDSRYFLSAVIRDAGLAAR